MEGCGTSWERASGRNESEGQAGMPAPTTITVLAILIVGTDFQPATTTISVLAILIVGRASSLPFSGLPELRAFVVATVRWVNHAMAVAMSLAYLAIFAVQQMRALEHPQSLSRRLETPPRKQRPLSIGRPSCAMPSCLRAFVVATVRWNLRQSASSAGRPVMVRSGFALGYAVTSGICVIRGLPR